MQVSPSPNRECFQPEDLDFLQQLFDRLCREGSLERGSLFAEMAAAWLIQIYQSGEKNEKTLLNLARERSASLISRSREIAFTARDKTVGGTFCEVIPFLAVRPRETVVRRKVDRAKIERADRESKVVLEAEREAREAKTARLRDQRLNGGCTEPKPTTELKTE